MVSIHTRIKCGLPIDLLRGSKSNFVRSGPTDEITRERIMAKNAIENNDLEKLEKAAGEMQNVDEPNICGKTLLMEAAECGSLEMVKYLKENLCADPRMINDYGKRALDYARISRNNSVIEYLQS